MKQQPVPPPLYAPSLLRLPPETMNKGGSPNDGQRVFHAEECAPLYFRQPKPLVEVHIPELGKSGRSPHGAVLGMIESDRVTVLSVLAWFLSKPDGMKRFVEASSAPRLPGAVVRVAIIRNRKFVELFDSIPAYWS